MPNDADDALRARLQAMNARHEALGHELASPELMSDHRAASRLAAARKALEPVVIAWREVLDLEQQIEGCHSILAAGDDPELATVARAELAELENAVAVRLDAARTALVRSGDDEIGSLVLEIRAGVGGDEAAIWAGDLLAMYQAFAGRRGWSVDLVDASPGEHGGFKHVVATVKGPGAWSTLGYEGGTHQVKRVPATEAQGRVHTSTATVAVLAEPEAVDVAIDAADVREMITTAQGPGGQNVNKVATAVHLIHEPTGIEVRIQDTKSQARNRDQAWRILRARIHALRQAEADAARAETRAAMIGRGDRAEKIRTYRWKENLVVDHRVDARANLGEVMAGGLDRLTDPLADRDIAERLDAL